ncbi:MAG TPA: sugar transferase [Candidatus Rifleibacterium sp.]|nr:sugar transferase [Candidatus Rifleibacterium sp.]HPT47741.1 sugar transferase [Candidatus Rifleibacterium sp.]
MKNLLPLLVFGVSDTLAIVVSGVMAYQIRLSQFFTVDPYLQNPGQYWLLLGVAVLLWHVMAAAAGAYRRKPAIFKIDELLFHYKASMLLVFMVMAVSFIYKQYDYSRLIVFLSGALLILTGNFFRQLAHRLLSRLYAAGTGNRNAAFYGNSASSGFLRQRIQNNPGCGLRLVDCQAASAEELLTFLRDHPIDDLFIFSDQAEYAFIWQLREASQNPALMIHLVPSFTSLYLRNLQGLFFDGMVMLSMSSPAGKRASQALKRLFDLTFAVLALVVFSPLLAGVALLIKLDSSGPVLFRQRRNGLNGVEFDIFKFRTMRSDVNPYSETPRERSDPRITRIGSFLRASGLDEMPQLLNVVRGEMSLVGPRPEMPFITEKYTPLEKQRLKIKPGITGLWQVYARSENLPIHHHIEYDLFYIENMSLLLDFIIIIDTIPTAVLRTGI